MFLSKGMSTEHCQHVAIIIPRRLGGGGGAGGEMLSLTSLHLSTFLLCSAVAHYSYLLSPQGGVILVSHDEHLINLACSEVWLCKNHSVYWLDGGLLQYKSEVENEFRNS